MPGLRQISPIGLRLVCEVCAEESVVALPVLTTRYQVVECPSCRSTYLVQAGGEGRAVVAGAAGDHG